MSDLTQARRRHPKQARSRELVARIQTVAGELFVERGYAGTNTNLIAERADVSVGSLYQFFADKDEILTALQEDWASRLGAALDQRLQADMGTDVGDIVDHVLDIHAALNRQPPGLLGFLLTAPTGNTAVLHVADAIKRRLVEMIGAVAPHQDMDRRIVVAAMIVHISNGLYTVGAHAGATNPLVRDEVRRALVAYIRPQLV
jgi:AcrR family transcriptional regulator